MTKRSGISVVSVGGVPLPVPRSHARAVRGAALGGGLGALGAVLLGLTPFGLAVLAAGGAFVGATEGARRDGRES